MANKKMTYVTYVCFCCGLVDIIERGPGKERREKEEEVQGTELLSLS